jgi:hypothetical protein
MSKKFILFYFIFSLTAVSSQELNWKTQFLSNQKVEADFFVGFDGMDNLYYIKNNVFFKKSKTKLWQYKNVSLGRITKIDIQNPLKIMLFFENFNTVILLDNQLIETQKINFSENEIPIMATATGIASGNRLWIYNSLTQQIGLFDYLKNTYQIITQSFKENIKNYYSDFNTFQWIDNNLTWYSCDIFGKITSLGKVPDFDQIQFITNQFIIFSKDGKLNLSDLNKDSVYTIENVDNSFENFYYKDQILSIFTNQEITNYKITIP